MRVTRMTCTTGSWSIYRGRPGEMQTVWMCGHKRPAADGRIHQHTLVCVCVHATRREARMCTGLVRGR